jgi:hypothetical protein
MSLQEVLFERLRHRYERACQDEPPFRSASVDEALSYLRQRLSQGEDATATRH